jgi:polyisoprenoid-binding protein YceI
MAEASGVTSTVDQPGARVDVAGEACKRFTVDAGASAIAIRARSNVGPITFLTNAMEGWIDAEVVDDVVVGGPTARLVIRVDTFQSGNSLYDAELLRRIDARRYPEAVLRLEDAVWVKDTARYKLTATLTVHDISRNVDGSVHVGFADGDQHRMTVTGEQVIDIRDFSLSTPAMLMLKIYPEVRVLLHLEADAS